MALKFIQQTPSKDTNQRTINVERNGRPFGQLWTFEAKGETHPWHAKTLAGDYHAFYAKDGGLTAAQRWLEDLAR